MNKIIFFGKKRLEYYKSLLIRADTGLHEQIASIIVNKVDKEMSILDMGCGQGALSLRLNDLGYQMTALDNNIDDFKADNKKINFIEINFNDSNKLESFVKKYSGMFDCVCGVEVIEHVENPWEYIRNLKSLLKDNGLLLVTTPNTTSWLSRIMFLFRGQFVSFNEASLSYGHINPVTSFELEVIMKQEDLKEIDIVSAGTLPPLYFSGIKMSAISLLALIVRPFQKRILDGWCILATARKQGL